VAILKIGKTLSAIGLSAFLLGVAPNYAPANNSNNLERTVMQEAVTAQQTQSVDEEKYVEIKKMFDDAGRVARGVIDNILIDGKDSYQIYRVSLKDVNLYKYNKKMCLDPTADPSDPKKKGSGRWGSWTKDKIFIPKSMLVKYERIKSSTVTPDFKQDDEVIFFMEDLDFQGKNAGLTSYLILSPDNNNLAVFKKLLADYNITDNYGKKY
jgi:hypothetical protein